MFQRHNVRFEISNTYRCGYSLLCIRNPHDDDYIFWSKYVADLLDKEMVVCTLKYFLLINAIS